MQPANYGAAFFANGAVREIPMSGDVLSVAGSETSGLLYSELTARKSLVVRVPVDRAGSTPETLTEGQEPALSPNGKWLAFIREEQGRGTVWLLATDSKDASQKVLPSTYQPLEVTVTDDGDVIAAAGTVSDPHLVIVRRGTRDVAMLSAFPHPARYPSISPDGKRLAFSRRDYGFWHLVVHRLATGDEQQLTHASCNASSPSWANAQTLLYATDCGRGIGLSAIARVVVPN
jgi:Tol biopolymer transport system component